MAFLLSMGRLFQSIRRDAQPGSAVARRQHSKSGRALQGGVVKKYADFNQMLADPAIDLIDLCG
jgi:hypothetical protein